MKSIIKLIAHTSNITDAQVLKIIQRNPKEKGKLYKKSELLTFYNLQRSQFDFSKEQEKALYYFLRKKRTRTISGVTPVTVLTMPYPCPGKCIFCPNDIAMPKSYISSEPGAQRATANKFDPYCQTFNRLVALNNMGHATDKIELIILGGTWTAYPADYRLWFVQRCFDGLNDFTIDSLPIKPGTETQYPLNDLLSAQKINETAHSRCVGLVIETRPDEIAVQTLIDLRTLGVTKVQLGVQSLNDLVLAQNKRGHAVKETKEAFKLLRQFGFKIHAHYMPNLLGSDPKKDIADFKKLFTDKNFKPDELKIYPCSLLEGTELMTYYHQQKWHPYSEQELLKVLTECVKNTPRYCRITRMIRDIPSNEIFVGNKKTNFRQIVEDALKKQGIKIQEIRSREIKDRKVNIQDLAVKETSYVTSTSTEVFIEYVTKQNEIAAFLRLSLVTTNAPISELKASSIIREVHVYGQSLQIGTFQKDKAQHSGLGKALIKRAKELSQAHGYKNMAVISSVGTREYYRKNLFVDGDLYQHMRL